MCGNMRVAIYKYFLLLLYLGLCLPIKTMPYPKSEHEFDNPLNIVHIESDRNPLTPDWSSRGDLNYRKDEFNLNLHNPEDTTWMHKSSNNSEQIVNLYKNSNPFGFDEAKIDLTPTEYFQNSWKHTEHTEAPNQSRPKHVFNYLKENALEYSRTPPNDEKQALHSSTAVPNTLNSDRETHRSSYGLRRSNRHSYRRKCIPPSYFYNSLVVRHTLFTPNIGNIEIHRFSTLVDKEYKLFTIFEPSSRRVECEFHTYYLIDMYEEIFGLGSMKFVSSIFNPKYEQSTSVDIYGYSDSDVFHLFSARGKRDMIRKLEIFSEKLSKSWRRGNIKAPRFYNRLTEMIRHAVTNTTSEKKCLLYSITVLITRPWEAQEKSFFVTSLINSSIQLNLDCRVNVYPQCLSLCEQYPSQLTCTQRSGRKISYESMSYFSKNLFDRMLNPSFYFDCLDSLLPVVNNLISLKKVPVSKNEVDVIGVFNWEPSYANVLNNQHAILIRSGGWFGFYSLIVVVSSPPSGSSMSINVSSPSWEMNLPIRIYHYFAQTVELVSLPKYGSLFVPGVGIASNESTRKNFCSANNSLFCFDISRLTSITYNAVANGRYYFRYFISDGCERSRTYTVELIVTNIKILASNVSFEIPSDAGINMTASILDLDLYEKSSIGVKFITLPNPNYKGMLFYGADRNPVQLDTSLTIFDTLYYVPLKFSSSDPEELIATFYLVDLSKFDTKSDNAHIIAKRANKDKPVLRAVFNPIELDGLNAASFQLIVEEYFESPLELHLSYLDKKLNILSEDQSKVLQSGLVSSDTVLCELSTSSISHHLDVILHFKLNTNESEISSLRDEVMNAVFYLKRAVASSREEDISDHLKLDVKISGSYIYTISTSISNTIIEFDQGDQSPPFSIFAKMRYPINSKDRHKLVVHHKFKITEMPSHGRIYKCSNLDEKTHTSNNLNLLTTETFIEEEEYNLTKADDGSYVVNSYLYLYYVPSMLEDFTYPSGDSQYFSYMIYNSYGKSSGPFKVKFKIKPKTILPTYNNATIYMKEESKYEHVASFTSHNKKFVRLNLYDFDKEHLKVRYSDRTLSLGDEISLNSISGNITLVFESSKLSSSSILNQNDELVTTVSFSVCDLDECPKQNMYSVNVHILCVQEPPNPSDKTITVIRTKMKKISLSEEVNTSNIRAKLMLTLPISGRLYANESENSLIDVNKSLSIDLESTDFYYFCETLHEENLNTPVDIFYYSIVYGRRVTKRAKLNLLVSPRGDAPVTSLSYCRLDQGRDIVLRLASKAYVKLEWENSDASVKILKLPKEGDLYDCKGANCYESNSTVIENVPYTVEGVGDMARLIYRPPAFRWGNPIGFIEYDLIDNVTNAKSQHFLDINVDHVNVPPTIQLNSSRIFVHLRQDKYHDFIWNVTDPDTMLSDVTLYFKNSIKVNHKWALDKCLDPDCKAIETYISGVHASRTEPIVLSPTKTVDDKCKSFNALYDLKGDFSMCYMLFVYRFYPDRDVPHDTMNAFTVIASDNQSSSLEYGITVRSILVNHPPLVRSPAGINIIGNKTSIPIRGNIMLTADYGRTVELSDFGAVDSCKEKLIMRSDTPGKFEIPNGIEHCTILPENEAEDSKVVVECVETLNTMNSWLPELKFSINPPANNSSVTSIELKFLLFDQGCSSSVQNDTSYYSEVAVTKISINPVNNSSALDSSSTISIAVGSAISSISLLGILTYFLRRRTRPSLDSYFDVYIGSIHTSPQNPLYQPRTQEYRSPLYRNM